MPLPAFLAGLGPFLQTPLGQGVAGAGVGLGAQAAPSIARGVGKGINMLGQKVGYGDVFDLSNPQDEILQYLQQQYMQEPQSNFGDIRNEEMRRFQQEILPMIQSQYGRGGGQFSSGYQDAKMMGAQDLSTRLNALGQQFQQQQQQQNLSRLSGLAGLRGQEQSYGLGRARQRQAGAQNMANLFGRGMKGFGDYRRQQDLDALKKQQSDFSDTLKLLNIGKPNTQQVYREAEAGMGSGAAGTY